MESGAEAGLISVVVVAADSGPLLQRCVAATLASQARVQLIVVDNASADDEVDRAAAVTAGDPRVTIIRNPTNLGFGAACNRGVRVARGEVVVFMNPDCEFADDVLSRMRDRLVGNRGIGLLGVCVCDQNGQPARGNRRRDPTLTRVFATMTGLARLESRLPQLRGVEMTDGGDSIRTDVEDVDAVSGACMGMTKKLFDEVSGFDEGFFLHFEDLDLCRRVRGTGRSVAIDHAIHVVHRQGSSSHHRGFFVARHKHDGLWRYLLKHEKRMRNPALRGLVWISLHLHLHLRIARTMLKRAPASIPIE